MGIKMGKFSNILIVTDLDGTFLGEKSEILDNNLEAVEYFKQNGGYFTFATGRMHKNITGAIPNPEKISNAPSIMANGTYIYDWESKSSYYEKFIPRDNLRIVLSFAREKHPHVGIRLACKNAIVTDSMSGYIYKDLHDAYLRGDVKIMDFDAMINSPDCFKVVFRAKPEELDAMRAELSKEGLLCGLTDSKSYPDFYEIQEGSCDKARGIAVLRETLEAKHGKFKIYACGDFENDEAMLKVADVAVCPANAIESIKEICHLCLCKNSEGLIDALIKWMNIHI